MTASEPMELAPSRMVHGSILASCPISMPAAILVVAGSTIVTPAS
jgi:hypothetical protein